MADWRSCRWPRRGRWGIPKSCWRGSSSSAPDTFSSSSWTVGVSTCNCRDLLWISFANCEFAFEALLARFLGLFCCSPGCVPWCRCQPWTSCLGRRARGRVPAKKNFLNLGVDMLLEDIGTKLLRGGASKSVQYTRRVLALMSAMEEGPLAHGKHLGVSPLKGLGGISPFRSHSVGKGIALGVLQKVARCTPRVFLRPVLVVGNRSPEGEDRKCRRYRSASY